jgi:gliding motility-associated-like protein
MGDRIELTFTQNTVSGTMPVVKSIQWSPSELLSCSNCQTTMASPFESTNYTVNVYYHNNCLATSTVRVPVYLPADFYVPTAFSPGNQDGVNDVLRLFGNGIKQVELRIYNRWGEKVYETTTIGQGWDGSYKGELQPTGVYTYSAKVVYLNNHTITKQGNVTLIR